MTDKLAQLGRQFWQFQIAGVALPHLKVRGRVGRRDGEWWLKTWAERLLFCAADAPERVFAVVTPCENEENLAEFWRAAVQRGDFGELFFHVRNAGGFRENGFLTIFVDEKKAWTREWCGGRWMPRDDIKGASVEAWKLQALVAHKPPNIFHSPFGLDKKSYLEANQRYFPQRERQNFKPFWLRGSRAEWKNVLQACVTTHFPSYARDIPFQPFLKGRAEYRGFAHAPFFDGWFSGAEEDGENWVLPIAWRALFRQHFVYVGWLWKKLENKDSSKRVGWQVQSLQTSAGIQLNLHPSQHELLEARLFLRDWLRDKVPAEQIARLLE